jgi:hypothetical protein
MSRTIRAWLTIAVGFALSAILAWLVLRRVDLAGLTGHMRQARLDLLALSLLTTGIGLLCMGWRASALLSPLRPVSVGLGWRGQLLGFAVNNVLPLRLGELAKADYYARHGSLPRGSTLAAAAAERILDALCVLVLLALVAPVVLPRFEHRSSLLLSALTVVAVAVTAWWLAAHPRSLGALLARLAGRAPEAARGRVAALADSFSQGFTGLASPRTAATAIAATLLYWLSALAGVHLWARAFALELPWYAPAVLLVFLAFGAALPAAPGFIGTWDYFFVLGLALFGVARETATAVALTGHAVAIIPFTVAAGALLPGELGRLAQRLRGQLRAGAEGP